MQEDTWHNRITGYGTEAPDHLISNPRNWRIHPRNQQAALKGSLTELGWIQNVIVNQRTGFVLDGHARVALALRHDQAEVPVTYVDLSEAEEALALATLDPISAMAGADKDQLEALLAGITTQDEALLDLVAGLGKEHGIDLGGGSGLTDPDEVPEPPVEPITKPGDLWLLGEHRLLCGDATAAADVERLLCGDEPALMVTDPPYGVDYEPVWREEYDDFKRHAVGKVTNDDRWDWGDAFALFPGSVAYVWHAGVYAAQVAAALANLRFEIRSQIIWTKQHFVFSRGHYHWQHEPCWYAVKAGHGAAWSGGRKQTTVWEIANHNPMGGNTGEGSTGHGTQKPIEAMARPIRNHSGDVYDPFLGSGTTLIAAEQLGRRCYGIEIDPIYCDVIVRRWENFTGQTASRERIEDAA